jgi:hypothetical protein
LGVRACKKRFSCTGHFSSPLPVCARREELPASGAERKALPPIFARRIAWLAGQGFDKRLSDFALSQNPS